jgi:RimJ/RimL family protein N-acetyltransferase
VSGERVEFPVEGITDGSIRIRLRSDADIPALIAACQDPEVPRWTRVPDHYDETNAAEWSVRAARLQESGEALPLAIADAETDRFLGSIAVQEIDRDEARCDLGYFLAPEARGRGVMTSAVRLVTRWAFENLRVERVQIKIQPQNARSRAVAERAGYTFEGVLRSHTVIKGRRFDMAMYSLLREQLQ